MFGWVAQVSCSSALLSVNRRKGLVIHTKHIRTHHKQPGFKQVSLNGKWFGFRCPWCTDKRYPRVMSGAHLCQLLGGDIIHWIFVTFQPPWSLYPTMKLNLLSMFFSFFFFRSFYFLSLFFFWMTRVSPWYFPDRTNPPRHIHYPTHTHDLGRKIKHKTLESKPKSYASNQMPGGFLYMFSTSFLWLRIVSSYLQSYCKNWTSILRMDFYLKATLKILNSKNNTKVLKKNKSNNNNDAMKESLHFMTFSFIELLCDCGAITSPTRKAPRPRKPPIASKPLHPLYSQAPTIWCIMYRSYANDHKPVAHKDISPWTVLNLHMPSLCMGRLRY